MTTAFSFTNYNTNVKGTARLATENQIKFYSDLCAQRNLQPQEDVANLSYAEVSSLIEELKKHTPPSQSQIELIERKILNLQSMEILINLPDTSKLTGGKEGSASKLIETLMQLEAKHIETAPPSENQLSFMVNMYLCPDVNFEEYGIARRITLEENLWRKLTPQEFADEIIKKMNRKEASKFIDKHRGTFHIWKSTRIKIEQEKYIRTLEARLSDTSVPTPTEWVVDIEGNLIQQTTKTEHSPSGYTPLDELELKMLSAEEAGKYIDILKSELERKELYRFGGSDNIDITFESLRRNDKEEEYKALKEIMFKIEAVAGYEDEDLHKTPAYLIAGEKEGKDKIKEVIQDLLKRDAITKEGMIELCKKSSIMQEILSN